jgi:hypothetical protein
MMEKVICECGSLVEAFGHSVSKSCGRAGSYFKLLQTCA